MNNEQNWSWDQDCWLIEGCGEGEMISLSNLMTTACAKYLSTRHCANGSRMWSFTGYLLIHAGLLAPMRPYLPERPKKCESRTFLSDGQECFLGYDDTHHLRRVRQRLPEWHSFSSLAESSSLAVELTRGASSFLSGLPQFVCKHRLQPIPTKGVAIIR